MEVGSQKVEFEGEFLRIGGNLELNAFGAVTRVGVIESAQRAVSDGDGAAWREAGADRYLLKFETSNPALYARVHPPQYVRWPA